MNNWNLLIVTIHHRYQSTNRPNERLLLQPIFSNRSVPDFKIMTSSPVYINISGMLFETRATTLTKYSDTLLGNRENMVVHYCVYTGAYFFERHRESFSSILFFYQSGKLCRPPDVNLTVFLDECDFFQLPEWAIDSMKRKEGGFLQDDIIDFLKPKKKIMLSLRERICFFFEDPTSSRYARYFAYFAVLLLSASIIINCCKTVEEFRPQKSEVHHSHDGWEITEIIINSYFLIEFVMRAILSLDKVAFCKSILVWIDLIALATFIPLLNKHYSNSHVILLFAPFQLFRVIRIIRLAKFLPQYNVTEIILKDCLGYFNIFATWFAFIATIAATIVYTLEEHEPNTKFISVAESMYWAIQTLVTLGYGDIIPRTPLGKLMASCFILGFIPTICVPTLTILSRFSKFYEFAQHISR